MSNAAERLDPMACAARDQARCVIAAELAESIDFRLGVLGATDAEKRRWAARLVTVLERPHLRPALAVLAGE